MSWAASTTYHYRIFVALMFFNLLYPMIPKLTSITTNTTSLIDNIFTNNVTCLSVNGPILNDLSDHLQFLFFSISRGNFDYDTTGSPGALFVGSGFRGHLVGIY